MDYQGRKRFGENHQTEEHAGESTKIFEEICQTSGVFSGYWL
jgi:hypothetical protein